MAISLTEKDLQLLAHAFQCFEGGLPAIDSKKLSALTGHKTPASAYTAWYNLKKKLKVGQATNGGGDEAAESTTKAPNRGKKRGAKAVAVEESGEGDVAEEKVEGSPKKKRGKKVKAEPVEETDDVFDEEVGASVNDAPAPLGLRYQSSKTGTEATGEAKKEDGADAERKDE